jgi:hypothetical protein
MPNSRRRLPACRDLRFRLPNLGGRQRGGKAVGARFPAFAAHAVPAFPWQERRSWLQWWRWGATRVARAGRNPDCLKLNDANLAPSLRTAFPPAEYLHRPPAAAGPFLDSAVERERLQPVQRPPAAPATGTIGSRRASSPTCGPSGCRDPGIRRFFGSGRVPAQEGAHASVAASSGWRGVQLAHVAQTAVVSRKRGTVPRIQAHG